MPKSSIKFEDGEFQKFLTNLINGLPSQTMLHQLGLSALAMIKKRTSRGIAADGSRFDKYNPQYAKRKEAETGRPTKTPDLIRDDREGMIASIDYLIDKLFKDILIYIKDPHKRRLARYHNKLGAGSSRVIRHFMGFNEQEEKRLLKPFRDVTKDIKKLKAGANYVKY